MIGAIIGGFSITQKLVLAVTVLSMIGVGYWWIWDTGREYERAVWVEASANEVARQDEINDIAREEAEILAEQLLSVQEERRALLRRLRNEARNDAGADVACIGPAGILRLNSVGGAPDTD